MTTEELWNRGNNLASIAVVTLAGFAFAPELFQETELPFKIDDTILLLLGIGALAWYKRKNNRFTRSIVPVLFVWAALLVKVAAIVIEFKDKEDVGDDFGGVVLFICATIFVLWMYFRGRYKK